ncbi:MAG: PilZ domain-containing protein [Myxococcota bacterium]
MQAVEFFVVKGARYSQERRHARVPADFPVLLKTESFRVSDRARDVSECGVGLETTQPLPVMSLVGVRLELPTGPIDVLGRVMWSAPNSMGVRFEQLDSRLSDSVAKLRSEFQRI